MQRRLQIGELARLAGVTTKTLRHYHRLGLLPEPLRSEGGYRLYGASDVQRLLHIRRLQTLGLPLTRIRDVLEAGRTEPELRSLLGVLRREIDEQIRHLESRRERIDALLAQPELDESPSTASVPAVLRHAFDLFDDELRQLDSDLLERVTGLDRRLFQTLDRLRWPDGFEAASVELLDAMATRPGLIRRLAPLLDRFLHLGSATETAPEVDALAREIAAVLPPQLGAGASAAGPFAELRAELLKSPLSLAQRRCLEGILAEQQHRAATESNRTAGDAS